MTKRSKTSSNKFPDHGPWLEDDLVVWRVRKNQNCSMCKRPLKKQRQDLASMQQSANRWFPTCLQCLHIDHLVFLPAGDSRVTRMASRLSSRRAVVMSTRHRMNRREGILVDISALREACEKYEIEIPPELQYIDPEPTPADSKKFTVPDTPELPRPTPQRTTRRESTRNYRFYEAPTPKAAENHRQDPAPKPVKPPVHAAQTTHKPDNLGKTQSIYTQILSDRIRDRYPRSPEPMVQDIAIFAMQVYLPEHHQNGQFPPANDVDLGPLLTAFLRR